MFNEREWNKIQLNVTNKELEIERKAPSHSHTQAQELDNLKASWFIKMIGEGKPIPILAKVKGHNEI